MDRRISLFLVCLVVAVGACATVDPWQDARIESEVKARLVAEKDANLTRLGVVSRQSVVYLTGDVVSAEQKARAESVATTVGGVRRVVNALEVRARQGAGRREGSSGEAPPEDRGRGVPPVR
jgi:hypothetical protein